MSQASQLRAEIEFWRDMIESEGPKVSAEAAERMRQALALAERKLLMLEPASSGSEDGWGILPGSAPESPRWH